mgnify:FL=1
MKIMTYFCGSYFLNITYKPKTLFIVVYNKAFVGTITVFFILLSLKCKIICNLNIFYYPPHYILQ